MEPSFQTSFIPKKPIIEHRTSAPRTISFFFIIAVFVLFTVIVATAGLYLYKGVLGKKLVQMDSNLTLAKNRFEPSKVTELQTLDKRLRSSNEILSKHVAITPIFEALGALTLPTVRYTKFDYHINEDGVMLVNMSGQAVGYRSVALQSDLFSTKEEARNFINPVFSNLTLDNSGNVLFDLEFSVDPSFVNYKHTLGIAS
ncbi:MAG TPA: hypothetical protein VEA37_05640 [Flavobacterium sp.]|nr:hypothetical protein [Flavobacterium sp.]